MPSNHVLQGAVQQVVCARIAEETADHSEIPVMDVEHLRAFERLGQFPFISPKARDEYISDALNRGYAVTAKREAGIYIVQVFGVVK